MGVENIDLYLNINRMTTDTSLCKIKTNQRLHFNLRKAKVALMIEYVPKMHKKQFH